MSRKNPCVRRDSSDDAEMEDARILQLGKQKQVHNGPGIFAMNFVNLIKTLMKLAYDSQAGFTTELEVIEEIVVKSDIACQEDQPLLFRLQE